MSYGYTQNPYLRNFTTTDGLPSNTIYQIYQDSKKFLWLTTDAGVVKYDGTTFKCFRKKDGLSSNDVIRIKEDSLGRIWFMNIKGSLNFLYKEKIYNEGNAFFLRFLISKDFFINFYEGLDKTIYFYNRYGEVLSLDSNYVVKRYNIGKLGAESPMNWKDCLYMYIHYLHQSPIGEFVFWTSCGIFKYKNLNEWKEDIDISTGVFGVFPCRDSILIVNSLNYGLHKYDFKYKREPIQLPCDNKKIKTIIVDKLGYIWFAASDQGVFCMKEGKLIKHFDIKNALGIIQDHENNIWISSMTDGLFVINYDVLFHQHIDQFNQGRNQNSGVMCLAIDSIANGIWCSNGKEIFWFNSKKEIYKLSPPPFGNNINIIGRISGKELAIGEKSNKLFILHDINYCNKNLIKYRSISKYPNNIKKFVLDGISNSFYTYDQAFIFISRYENPAQNVARYYVGERIYNIFLNSKNQLIINGHRNFVYQNNRKWYYKEASMFDGKIINEHHIIGKDTEIFNIDGDSIYLIHMNKMYNLSASFNIPIDLIIKNTFYSNSKLYMSTSRSVYICYDPLSVIHNKRLNINSLGPIYKVINDIAILNDTLYIASSEGITVIPQNSHINKIDVAPAPIPYFKTISINNNEVEQHLNSIELTGKKKISISFGDICFSSDNVYYSYKLEGLDNKWTIGLKQNSTVVYQNLPKGIYVFNLKARKSNSEWSSSEKLIITIKPTFYEYALFWVFMTLILGILIFLIIRKIKIIRMKKIETREQLIYLEQKSLLSMMNPHFVFNSLGSIQNYLIKNKVRDAISYLSQFARLIRQNLYAVNLTVIDLDEEIVRLRNYLDLERIRLENKFEYSIDIEEPFNEDSFIIPSMIIQPFAENAIWHGIATMENNGLVSISFILFSDQLIKIVIEDNGIGVEKASKAAKSNSNATKKHLHLGMEMTKKRLQLLNQKYNVDAHLEITDVNPGTEYPGTRVSIYIPFNFEIGGSSLMVIEDED